MESTAEDATENATERRRRNDPAWVAGWPVREQLTACATDALFAAARLATGSSVLDVGSGCGATLRLAAELVGASGRATGVDVSAALVAAAREAVDDCPNANVLLADAATDDLDGPYDQVISRFGVMFFDHPAAAFANLRRHARRAGRLAACAWMAAEENPWHLSHAIGRFVDPPPTPMPGAHATGPFALSDAGEVRSLLVEAGWRDVVVAGHRGRQVVDREAIVGQVDLDATVAATDRAAAVAALSAHEAAFSRPDGRLDVPVAFFVVTATAP